MESVDAMPRQTFRIFLSYGHDEYAELAVKLKKDLEARGHHVWFDEERLKPGGDWQSHIEEGLEWAAEDPARARVLLLMTPHSVRRPDGYCLNEIARAVDRGMSVVPVMVVEVEPPLSICRIQWLDMRDCFPVHKRAERYRGRFSRLIEALEEGRIDFEGAQARLHKLLNPLPFDADIAQHLPRFTGRQWLFKKIDLWMANPDATRVFWIVGGAGVGKTAIATWLCGHRGEIAAFHLCRHGHDQKSDPRQVVRSIAYQLSSQLPDYEARLNALSDLEELISESNAKTLFDRLVVQLLHSGFPRPDRTIVLLIDGLDEASCDGRNELCEFLSHEFAKLPDWVRLILTSRPDPEVMQPLQGLEPEVIEADSPDNLADVRVYIEREFAVFAEDRTLSQETSDLILERSEGIFLYVDWVRKELAAGRLSLDRPEEFPKGLGGVYDEFFRRRFPDLHSYKATYRPLLEAVAAAREPLELDYLAALFDWSAYEREEIPAALGSLFPCVEGKLRAFHHTVLEWVSEKKRSGPYFVSVKEGHRRLAVSCWSEYEQGLAGMSEYAGAHLPRHLLATGRWDELVSLLTDLAYLRRAWEANEDEVKALWVEIEKHSEHRMVDAYHSVITEPRGDVRTVFSLGWLLRAAGHLDEAMPLLAWSDGECRRVGDLPSLQRALLRQGIILQDWGCLDKAMKLYKESEEISRQIGDMDFLQKSLGNQGNILSTWGQLDKAMALHKEEERICRELGLKAGLKAALSSQAYILKDWGQLDEAMALHKEEERICRESGLKDGLSAALSRQAGILGDRGQLKEAMALYRERERICRELGHKSDLAECLSNQAIILSHRGDPEGALALFKEDERICRDLGRKRGLAICLGNQAVILRGQGDLDSAMCLHEEEERICRELNDKDTLHYSLGNQGVILHDCGDVERAMALFKEKDRLCRELGNKKELQVCLGNQATVLANRGDLRGAMALYKQQEQICRQLDVPSFLAACLVNQAITLAEDLGQSAEALRLAEEAYRLASEHGLEPLKQRARNLLDNLRSQLH